MSFDLARILESKRQFRERLAARPVAEKLAMLDAMRARHLSIQRSKSSERLQIQPTEPARPQPAPPGSDSNRVTTTRTET